MGESSREGQGPASVPGEGDARCHSSCHELEGRKRGGEGRGEGETREGKGGGVGRQRTIPELVQRRAVEWRCLTRAADDKG